MLRRVLTKLWNKEGVHRVGILFEYRDEKAFLHVSYPFYWKSIIFQWLKHL